MGSNYQIDDRGEGLTREAVKGYLVLYIIKPNQYFVSKLNSSFHRYIFAHFTLISSKPRLLCPSHISPSYLDKHLHELVLEREVQAGHGPQHPGHLLGLHGTRMAHGEVAEQLEQVEQERLAVASVRGE